MQFPESWLRAFCNPSLSTQQLADTLTMAGLEVEDIKPVAPPFSKIVVGEIKEASQHPNADRLRVCKVDAGQPELLTIVCGAPNARVGIRIPCALVGAELPPGDDGKPFLIKLGTLRGVESQGMLCSAKELHLSDEQNGLLELISDAPLGQCIRTHLNLDDALFTLKLTPNLAHCLSVYGVAREVSALTGAALVAPELPSVQVTSDFKLAVNVSAPDLCGRFSGRVVRNLNTQAVTPRWMLDRLARCGQRSVSALVDISNYVMFEMGQPSHIFDLDKIQGGLEVRWGRAGEQIKLLNGSTIVIDANVGVIADDSQVESLAGIMGGDATAVSNDTSHVYVEAAFWWPKAVAGRSRRFNFSTDAGHRFERGVDPSQTVNQIERITQLIIDICGTPHTQCGPIDDHVINVPVIQPVHLRVARAVKVIGMPLHQQQCVDALERLGLSVSQSDGVLTVTPPPYRFDLQIEEDLIEEVARMVGYNNLPHTPPIGPITSRVNPESRRSAFAARRLLADLGYQETINFSFVEEKWESALAGNTHPIRLQNPISSQMSVMRSSLIGSLLQVLKFNLARKAPRVRVFEVGRVFLRDVAVENSDTTVQGFHQPMRIAGLANGGVDSLQWGSKDRLVDFFDVKGDIQALLAPLQATFLTGTHPAMHPGRCAQIQIDGRSIGFVGEMHPQWRALFDLVQAPVLFELDFDAVLQRVVPEFHPVAKFPAVQRDLAVVVDDHVTHSALMSAIWGATTEGLLRDAQLFDVYRPKIEKSDLATLPVQERSLAVRLTLGSHDATLTEDQIELVVASVVQALSLSVNARQRV